MPGFLKKRFSDRNPDENWQQTLRRLRKNLVPLSGEAETLQGELVRCVDNLNDEATRNGWMNWDAGDEEAIEVLRRYLPDGAVFSEEVNQQIRAALDKVRYAGEKGADEGFFGYEELTFLTRRIVDWCNHHEDLLYKSPQAKWLDEDPFKDRGQN